MRLTNILIVAVIACVLIVFGYEVGIVHERYIKPTPGPITFTNTPPWLKGGKVECSEILKDGRVVSWYEAGPWCHSIATYYFPGPTVTAQ